MFKSVAFSVLALSLSASAAFAAPAASQGVTSSILREFRLDPKLNKGITSPGTNHLVGSILVDQVAKKVTLTVNEAPTCAAGAMCPQYLVQVLDVQLPLIRTITDGCQNVVITASQDLRPVDGQLEVIQITDHSRSVCDVPTPFLTTVTYTTSFYSRTGGGEQKTESLLQGDALKAAR